MTIAIVVISQRPPGGRCTLYARYAETIGKAVGGSVTISFSDLRGAHDTGFPSLLLDGSAVQPADGVILTPADIASVVAAALDAPQCAALTAQLDAVLEAFLADSAQE